MVSSLAALAVCTAASAAAAAAAPFPPAGGLEQTAFMSSPSGFGADWQGRQRQGSGRAAQAVQSKPGSSGGGEASRDRRVAVHDDSWYLGDGGFAARHMEDEVRLAAKKVRGGRGERAGLCCLVACVRFCSHWLDGHDRHPSCYHVKITIFEMWAAARSWKRIIGSLDEIFRLQTSFAAAENGPEKDTMPCFIDAD